MKIEKYQIKVFIIHAINGYEFHLERIEDIFAKENIDFEVVTDGDVSLFTPELINTYFHEDVLKHIKPGYVSCNLNHFIACERIVSQNLPFAIIMENDPCLENNYRELLLKVIKEMEQKDEALMISLENSCMRFPSYWQTKSGQYLYPAHYGRMAGAYIINQKGAKALLEFTKKVKCNNIIDWWHNELIKNNVLKMYWAHPTLVEQGSHNGLLSSTISSKPSSFKRKVQWNIQKYFQMYIGRLFNERRIKKD